MPYAKYKHTKDFYPAMIIISVRLLVGGLVVCCCIEFLLEVFEAKLIPTINNIIVCICVGHIAYVLPSQQRTLDLTKYDGFIILW